MIAKVLSYEDAKKIMDDAIAQGINPTYQYIMDIAKIGSRTTIFKHKKQYESEQKPKQSSAYQPLLPHDLLIKMRATICNAENEVLAVREGEFQSLFDERKENNELIISIASERDELSNRLSEISFEKNRLATKLEISEDSIKKNNLQIEDLRFTVTQAELTIMSTKTRNESHLIRIDEQQSEIAELRTAYEKERDVNIAFGIRVSSLSSTNDALIQKCFEVDELMKHLNNELEISNSKHDKLRADFEHKLMPSE